MRHSWLGRTKASWRRYTIRSVVLTLVAAAAVALSGPAPAAATIPAGGMDAAAVSTMFATYGDAGGHWTGGDSTASVLLPDGRVAWLFSDTYLGTVNTDGSRPANTPMVNNSIVVQDGTGLVNTLYGGTSAFPRALVTPQQQHEFFWVANGLVENGQLKVLYNRYTRNGLGNLDFVQTGTSLATFSLPALTLLSVTDLPVGRTITWGSALLAVGSYTYVYGTSSGLASMKYGHVARVAAGNLGGSWEYWTGAAWSTDPATASRILSGVGTGYAVQPVGNEYVLITQENNFVFDRQFVAYRSTSPTGPFTGPVQLFSAPEAVPGNNVIVYDARLHPELARSGKLLLSYNVNSLNDADNYSNARLYRPRFLELDWPPATPTGVPAAPTGLTASTDASGGVHLSWSAVSGATRYRVYRQYVTGGQTHFSRYSTPVTGTSVDNGGFVRGHRYDFKVTAENAAGESVFSSTVSITPTAPTDVSTVRGAGSPNAVANGYLVRLKNLASVTAAGVGPFAQELAGQYGATVRQLFPNTLNGFSATMSQANAIAMAAHPDVLDVEQIQGGFTLEAGGTQDTPPWGLDRVDQRDLPRDLKYRYPNSGEGVAIYVVDSGIDGAYNDVGTRVAAGYNALDGSTNVTDCTGHGTAIADVAAGTVYGMAKQATVVPVKVANCAATDTTTEVLLKGLEWVSTQTRRPAVVNVSGTLSAQSWTTTVEQAVLRLMGTGVTVVAAAGNQTADACTRSPGRLPGVITVGATGLPSATQDARWGQSNFGSCVDLFAPGQGVDSSRKDHTPAPATNSGTSFAAPHVAGAAALVLAAHPSYSPAEVADALVKVATSGKIADAGTGSPNRLLFVQQTPDAAANLAATQRPDGTIGLAWTASPTSGVEYLVSQRDVTLGEAEFSRWPVAAGTGTTATATGLSEGHTYEFTVAASNAMGVSSESNVASAVVHMAPPAAPTNLTATSQSDGTIALSWTAPGPDVWFNVYQRDVTAEETEFLKLPLPITVCCAMTASYLVHGHVYEFRVAATNQGGEGTQSNPAQATAQYALPTAPTGLAAQAGDGQVLLTWTDPVPDTWFNVYQRDVTVGETEFTQLPLPVTVCCTFTDGYLANSHTYEFKVTATNAAGESGPSNLVQATPLAAIPGQVTNLIATANTDGSIGLSWTAPTGDNLWYDVYQRDVTAGETGFTKLPLPVTTCCSLTAAYLANTHVYQFKLAATNGRAGPLSAVAEATSHYTLPPAPTNSRATTAGDNAVQVDWDASGDLKYWVYLRDVSAGQTTFTKSFVPSSTTEFRWTDLWPNHAYQFKVTAENQGGEGAASNVAEVTALASLPAAPSGLTATAGDGQAVLRWTASATSGVTYSVYQQDTTTGESWKKLPLPATCCTMSAGLLTNGHTYRFKVAAGSAAGESAPSNVVSVKPMPPIPQAPGTLYASAGDGQVTLTWTKSATDYVGYVVELRAAGAAWRALPTQVGCCSYVVKLLDNGKGYEFQVRAANLSGVSAPSNTAIAKPMPPLPAAPSGLTASAGDGQVSLSWTKSSTSNVMYLVEYRARGGTWVRLPYPVSCCSNTVRYLANGTSYEFRVRGSNLAGAGSPSNVVTARPMPPVPKPPTNLVATYVRGTTVFVDWIMSPTAGVGYSVYERDDTAGGGWTKLPYPVYATEVTLAYHVSGHTYSYKVTASNLSGEGAASNVDSARVPLTTDVHAKLTCTSYIYNGVGYMSIDADAWGWVDAANTRVTVIRTLYVNGETWSNGTDFDTTDSVGGWSVPRQGNLAKPGGSYGLFVQVLSPSGATLGSTAASC